MGNDVADVMLTYAQLGEELGISPAGARMLAKRHRLPKITDNHGRAVVSIEAERLARFRAERSGERESRPPARPAAREATPAAAAGGNAAALQAHIEDLRAVVAAHQQERESLRRLLARFLEAREREREEAEAERRRLVDEVEQLRDAAATSGRAHEEARARWEAERRALGVRLDQFEEELARAAGRPAARPSWIVRVFRRR
jgi:chromosome segregation ATPase